MKRKGLSMLLLFVFAAFTMVFAQQKKATISFDKETHDFGTIKEEGGEVTYKFNFTNTGGDPLIINKVKASCGCTTPDWTKEPIAPGAKGFVSAKYNPKNRPNKFNKTITVTSNASTPTKVLRITGNVTPREKGINDFYPQTMGELRLKSNHIAFTKIKNTETRTESVEVINTSKEKSLTVTFENIPKHIQLKVSPATIKPGEKAKISAIYDAKVKNDWGFINDRVNVLINGEKNPRNRLTISATIEEDFSKMTEKEKANAPTVEFESKVFEFGEIKQGDVVDYEFKFKNTGKSDLVIRKTKTSCGCTAVNLGDKVIKPGQSSSFKTTFNSRGKRKKQNKTITVITNDPINSSVILRVKGNVVVPEGVEQKKPAPRK
jgi:hypothetical protein